MSVFCTKCGAEAQESQNFCGKCGAPVRQQPTSSLEAIAAEAVASTPVGWEIDAPAMVSTASVVVDSAADIPIAVDPAAAAIAVPLPEASRLCPHGHPVPDGVKYCPVCGLIPEEPPPKTKGGLEIADAGVRFGAYLIDIVVFLAGLFFFLFVWYAIDTSSADSFAASGFSGVLTWGAYLVPCWAWWGTSVGKRILKIKIVTESGAKPGFGRALVRYIVMTFLGAILGLTWWPVLWRDDNRAIHDLAAGLWVVRGTPE